MFCIFNEESVEYVDKEPRIKNYHTFMSKLGINMCMPLS